RFACPIPISGARRSSTVSTSATASARSTCRSICKVTVMTSSAVDIDNLLGVMAALRVPDGGCPWDIEQDFDTFAPYAFEEAYEAAEAIALRFTAALKDELSDMLFEVIYHAQIAEEQAAFTFADLVSGIIDKMIRRHPHVFGEDEM